MDAQLDALVQRFHEELSRWLDQPSEADRQLASMKAQAEQLKATLGAKAVADMLKPLERAGTQAKRARQREAAEAIAAALKPIGIVLEAKEPPKRSPRRATGKPVPPKAGDGSSTGH